MEYFLTCLFGQNDKASVNIMEKSKKKIGVITHYYKSFNYGGLLQSYALIKMFQKNNFIACQIQYDSSIKQRKFTRLMLHIGNKFITMLKNFIRNKKRIEACSRFRTAIPHTREIYNYKNISTVEKNFDAFVTGSDQVWNPSEINVGYSLSFTNKPKFSYAASIGVKSLTSSDLAFYESFLQDYRMVSVRERNAVELLQHVRPISLVLDPVFLLTKDEWLSLASKKICTEKYIFYYLLGDDAKSRCIVENFAKEKGWRIFVIPYLNGKNNVKKGDLFRKDISPNDFLSLIANAECVMTDSFHALCFSYIFKKDFYAFSRVGGEHMNIRIHDFLLTIDCRERMIDSPCDYTGIDYSKKSTAIFDDVKEHTFLFFDKMTKDIIEL